MRKILVILLLSTCVIGCASKNLYIPDSLTTAVTTDDEMRFTGTFMGLNYDIEDDL